MIVKYAYYYYCYYSFCALFDKPSCYNQLNAQCQCVIV